MPEQATYHVEVTALQNGVESVPAATAVELVRAPNWWVPVVIAITIALL